MVPVVLSESPRFCTKLLWLKYPFEDAHGVVPDRAKYPPQHDRGDLDTRHIGAALLLFMKGTLPL